MVTIEVEQGKFEDITGKKEMEEAIMENIAAKFRQ
jgi:hypothetical protein